LYCVPIGKYWDLRNRITRSPSTYFLGHSWTILSLMLYRGADKSLARPGRKQATATEDFEFHISYL